MGGAHTDSKLRWQVAPTAPRFPRPWLFAIITLSVNFLSLPTYLVHLFPSQLFFRLPFSIYFRLFMTKFPFPLISVCLVIGFFVGTPSVRDWISQCLVKLVTNWANLAAGPWDWITIEHSAAAEAGGGGGTSPLLIRRPPVFTQVPPQTYCQLSKRRQSRAWRLHRDGVVCGASLIKHSYASVAVRFRVALCMTWVKYFDI